MLATVRPRQIHFLTKVMAAGMANAPMTAIVNEDLKITVDDDGFLASLEDWSETAAHVLAAQEGVGELSEDKRDFMKFMRE